MDITLLDIYIAMCNHVTPRQYINIPHMIEFFTTTIANCNNYVPYACYMD